MSTEIIEGDINFMPDDCPKCDSEDVTVGDEEEEDDIVLKPRLIKKGTPKRKKGESFETDELAAKMMGDKVPRNEHGRTQAEQLAVEAAWGEGDKGQSVSENDHGRISDYNYADYANMNSNAERIMGVDPAGPAGDALIEISRRQREMQQGIATDQPRNEERMMRVIIPPHTENRSDFNDIPVMFHIANSSDEAIEVDIKVRPLR